MKDRRKAIVTATAPIVLLVAYLSGGIDAVTAMLATLLILAIPLALLVGLVLLVLNRM